MSDEKLERLQGSLNGVGDLGKDLNRSLNEVVNLFQSVNQPQQNNNTGTNTSSSNESTTTTSDKK